MYVIINVCSFLKPLVFLPTSYTPDSLHVGGSFFVGLARKEVLTSIIKSCIIHTI